MSDDVKIYMGNFWVQSEGGTITLGLTEETIADFDEIVSFDFPEEQQNVEADEVCGTIETNDGPIDIYSPVSGSVIEVNTTLIEDSSVLMEDPTGEGWLLKFTADEDYEDEDEDEDDEDDLDDEDEDEDDDYEDEDED
ncbi:MAG: glycine cleavage system protein ue [Pseudomonadota bacterium]|jgi:glycine cleavage system H protein